MLPVIVIVGRPNVGKSTLFNYLTKTRDALVADLPGLTRDRQYGEGQVGDRNYIVVDTGGLHEPDDPEMAKHTEQQVEQAIQEADCLLFMVDAQAGLSSADEKIAKQLRGRLDKVELVINKSDSLQSEIAASEFYQLGLKKPYVISATRGRGIQDMMAEVLVRFPKEEMDQDEEDRVRVAIVGRPNVGKSTLINRMLGEERVVVYDRPGTTRDSVFIPFDHMDKKYTLIDTAGVRRRARVSEVIEKFSIIKTMQAIEKAHVVVLVLDAQAGLTDQDMKLLGLILQMGKALVLAYNKWDGMDEYMRTQFKDDIDRRLQFANFARRYFISALHGSGVGKLYHAVDEAYASLTQEMTTPQLTKILLGALKDHPPPLAKGRRIKPRFAHIGGRYPLLIIIHGKQVETLPNSYQRYLVNCFRKALNLVGVPVLLRFKRDDNPYE